MKLGITQPSVVRIVKPGETCVEFTHDELKLLMINQIKEKHPEVVVPDFEAVIFKCSGAFYLLTWHDEGKELFWDCAK